jgi:hypothetical protein
MSAESLAGTVRFIRELMCLVPLALLLVAAVLVVAMVVAAWVGWSPPPGPASANDSGQ